MRLSFKNSILFTFFITFTSAQLHASVTDKDDQSKANRLYGMMQEGSWRDLNPDTVSPRDVRYYSTTEGIMVSCDEIQSDTEDAYQYATRLSLEDFIYRLSLLPHCLQYCLKHQNDEHLLSSALPSIESPSTILPHDVHAYHFLHHVLETPEHLMFFRKIAPQNLLEEHDWQALEILMNKRQLPKISSSEGPSAVQSYFQGANFIEDMRTCLVSLLGIIRPTDLIIGVGNTPQLPLYALKRICPFFSTHSLPISGWAGTHKASSTSWLDNVITPDALKNFDSYLNLNIVNHPSNPKRLVFIDLLNYGFSIDFTLSRLQSLYRNSSTKLSSLCTSSDSMHRTSTKSMPEHLVLSLNSPFVIDPSIIFGTTYRSLSADRLGSFLDSMDAMGRMMPHATMRHWDKGTPMMEKPDASLDPILEHLNQNFAELKL